MATNGKSMEDMIAASEASTETTGTSSESASTLSGYVLINNTSAARPEKISDQDLELIVRERDDARGRAAALESEREILMARIAVLLSLLSPKQMALYTSIYPEKESVQRIVPTSFIPGLQYQPVPGDGHCLFNAVALHVGQDHSFLRKLVAARIEFNMAQYRSIIKVLNPKKTPEEYLQDLRQGIEWADNLEITVLMKMLDRPIVIIGLDGSIRNLLDLVGEGDPIFVQYNGHNHYDALVLTGEKTSREIFKAMTQLIGHSPKGRSDNSNSTSAHSITASCSDPSQLISSASAAAAYVPPISHAFDSAAAHSFHRSAAHPSSTSYASSNAPLTFGTSSACMSVVSGSLMPPADDQSPEDTANFAALDEAEIARRGSIAQSEAQWDPCRAEAQSVPPSEFSVPPSAINSRHMQGAESHDKEQLAENIRLKEEIRTQTLQLEEAKRQGELDTQARLAAEQREAEKAREADKLRVQEAAAALRAQQTEDTLQALVAQREADAKIAAAKVIAAQAAAAQADAQAAAALRAAAQAAAALQAAQQSDSESSGDSDSEEDHCNRSSRFVNRK